MKSATVSLGTVLGLRPLDRVQLNNAHEIREAAAFRRQGGDATLPFYYFQRVLEGGLLELRSPGGYAVSVLPTDICDVIRGEPCVVRAMPHHVFLDRLRLPVLDRQAPLPECYADAYVLYVVKDKYGFAEPMVWFKDSSLNASKSFRAPVLREDLDRLKPLARRTRMPVQRYGSSANYSADHGVARGQSHVESIVQTLFFASLRHHPDAVAHLTSLGDAPIRASTLRQFFNEAAREVSL